MRVSYQVPRTGRRSTSCSSAVSQPARAALVHRQDDEIRSVDIGILPEYCHRGIGTALLRGLQSEAAAAGKPRLRSSRYGGQAAARSRRAAASFAETQFDARTRDDQEHDDGALFEVILAGTRVLVATAAGHLAKQIQLADIGERLLSTGAA
jgi:hypothetical protein